MVFAEADALLSDNEPRLCLHLHSDASGVCSPRLSKDTEHKGTYHHTVAKCWVAIYSHTRIYI